MITVDENYDNSYDNFKFDAKLSAATGHFILSFGGKPMICDRLGRITSGGAGV